MDYSKNVLVATSKLMESGAMRSFNLARKLDTYSGIVWPLNSEKFLFVYPNTSRINYVDREMRVLPEKVDEADKWIVSHAMDLYVEKFSSMPDPDRVLDELSCNRRFAIVYYLKKVLELGTEKLKLRSSKIVDGYFFYAVAVDKYVVLCLSPEGDDFRVFASETPEISECRELSAIWVSTEQAMIYNLKNWVQEALV